MPKDYTKVSTSTSYNGTNGGKTQFKDITAIGGQAGYEYDFSAGIQYTNGLYYGGSGGSSKSKGYAPIGGGGGGGADGADSENNNNQNDPNGRTGWSGGGISDSLTNDELYLYKYLMVYKTTDFGYPVKVGDVMRLSSSYIEGNFIVNKIKNTGSAKYIYMFTEFNDTIITNLKGYTASIVNLNVYSNVDEFENRFNQHPICNKRRYCLYN
jgi:hypothetical protein